MTIFGFVANLGGLFGLCLGFSIVSFIEILYWFSIGLCRNITK
jgi:amiloride-sensitive sodium channel